MVFLVFLKIVWKIIDKYICIRINNNYILCILYKLYNINFKKYNNINNNLLQKNKIIDKYINFNTILSLNISFNVINNIDYII